MITLFRHCPACGMRFGVKLTDDRVLSEGGGLTKTVEPDVLIGFRRREVPVRELAAVASAKDYEYDFRCNKCGHEWSEVRTRVEEEPVNLEYKGD